MSGVPWEGAAVRTGYDDLPTVKDAPQLVPRYTGDDDGDFLVVFRWPGWDGAVCVAARYEVEDNKQ